MYYLGGFGVCTLHHLVGCRMCTLITQIIKSLYAGISSPRGSTISASPPPRQPFCSDVSFPCCCNKHNPMCTCGKASTMWTTYYPSCAPQMITGCCWMTWGTSDRFAVLIPRLAFRFRFQTEEICMYTQAGMIRTSEMSHVIRATHWSRVRPLPPTGTWPPKKRKATVASGLTIEWADMGRR